MKISSIEPQKKNQDRVSVYLDGDFWTGMTQNLLIQTGISPGLEISAERKKEIEDAVVEDSALSYAIRRISRVMTSESTLRKKLAEKEYGESVQDKVIEELKRLVLLDDYRMAEMVCEDAAARKRGLSWARRKLIDKGLKVDEDLLERTFPEETEKERSLEALDSITGGRRIDLRDQRRRQNTLISRGFSWEAASYAVSERALTEEEEAELHGADEARALVERKYGGIETRQQRSKAWAFLRRRGFMTSVIEEALR